MRTWKRMLFAAAGAGFVGASDAHAQRVFDPNLTPAAAPCPPIRLPAGPCPCPPGPVYPAPIVPIVPPNGTVPPVTPPVTPPGDPNTPPNTLPPVTPPAGPEAARPDVGAGSNLLAEAPARGTSSGGSLLPTINGDLLGGGNLAGPLPVRIASNGQIVSTPPIVVLPNGQRVVITGRPTTPVDELVRQPAPATPQQIAQAQTVGLLPPPGTVFDQSLASFVSRVPQIVRGPFKVTENDTPRPTTRAYVSYYFYDNVSKGSGEGVPRITVNQQVFGYEQAFLDRRASVSVRLPYNQLVSPGFYNDTGLGDLTFVTKYVLAEDRETGNLLSTGVLVTVPTGSRDFGSTIAGGQFKDVLIQPFLGYIVQRDRAYAQGFTTVVVPTDGDDVTLFTNDLQLGYQLYRNPGAILSSFIPTVEGHLNIPLNHRGASVDPVGFPTQFTALGGGQFIFRDRFLLGTSVGAPLTGPRPFSLQATVQLNYFF